MKICGLKLTHDSGISMIENGRLTFSLELEKIKNNPRYFILDDLKIIPELLSGFGYDINQIDKFSIDGWVGTNNGTLALKNNNIEFKLDVAPYEEPDLDTDLFSLIIEGELPIGDHIVKFESYPHVLNHILSAYCSSAFAKNKESSYVLIWDGGMFPRLYFVDAEKSSIKNLGALFYLGVNIYSIFSQHFRPFKLNANVIKDELSIAGKVMAYSSFGEIKDDIVNDLEKVYQQTVQNAQNRQNIPTYPYHFANAFIKETSAKGYFDEDILASFQYFLEQKLINGLKTLTVKDKLSNNLCFAGGAALNIKWNSSIRESGLFNNMWVCPFPNDSGSAIGAACSSYSQHNNISHIDWNVYSGPKAINNAACPGWSKTEFTNDQLAFLLHSSNEPVIVLNGNAELGPRALGNRSILASATSQRMKQIFNDIKIRESYRPIAPICLEEMAPNFFEPGTPDPYMLFTHVLKPEWRDKVPAICHVDHTSRLQTVDKTTPFLYNLLTNYQKHSKLPLLCNSSANFKGSGFFPDVYSASKWGKVNYIWCDNYLYQKIDKVNFI